MGRKKLIFGTWYAKTLAICVLMAALGLGKPWELVAFAGEVRAAIDKTQQYGKIQAQNAEIHQAQRVLNAAQETKVDMLATIMLQNARGGGSVVQVNEALNNQLVVLAGRIADLNKSNADLRSQLSECRRPGEGL